MSTNTINLLESFLKQDPTDGFTIFALAMEYKKSGDVVRSEKNYKHLLDLDPNYVGVYYHLGKLLEETTRIDEARIIYEKGIKVAQSVKDLHAASELQQALMELE